MDRQACLKDKGGKYELMYGDCLESDWKQFRKKVPVWQEAYMERLVEEYQAILRSKENASEKFWTLEKRIAKDKHNPGVVIDMRRSQMRNDIVYLLQYGVIVLEDLEGFSQALQDDVTGILESLNRE